MKGALVQQRQVSPRTRQQQQSRLWSMLLLLCVLGPLSSCEEITLTHVLYDGMMLLCMMTRS